MKFYKDFARKKKVIKLFSCFNIYKKRIIIIMIMIKHYNTVNKKLQSLKKCTAIQYIYFFFFKCAYFYEIRKKKNSLSIQCTLLLYR